MSPSVLSYRDIKGNHGPKLALLQERLGISKEAAGRLFLKGNRVLGTSLATLEKKMDWLQARLNLNRSQLRTIVERVPNALTYSIEDNLGPTFDNIQSILELSDKELTKIIARKPDVLQYNMSAENMTQRMPLLQTLLGLQEDDIEGLRKKCVEAPNLLFWPEESMKGNQQWLRQRFGLGDAKIAQMCRFKPQLLYANATTLDDKAGSIQSDLSLSDDELSDLVSKFPTLLGYCPEKNVRQKLRYLRTRFELDEDALKNLVLKQPALFSLSQGNIEEKLQFYSKLVGEEEAKRLVVKSSNLLMRSLEKRLKPRLEEVKKIGVKVRWNDTLLRRLAMRTDGQWEAYGLGDTKT